MNHFSSHKSDILVSLIPVEAMHVDPVDLKSLSHFDIFRAVHEKLLTTEGALDHSEGALIDDIQFRDGSMHFRLKKGLNFSNGDLLLTDDVIFSFKRALFLGHEKSYELAKCTEFSEIDPSEIMSNSKVFTKIDDLNFSILVNKCVGDELNRELSRTTFAVVNRKHLNKNLAVTIDTPVSGAFTFNRSEEDGYYLAPNKKNWRYKEAQIQYNKIELVKLDSDNLKTQIRNIIVHQKKDIVAKLSSENLVDDLINEFNLHVRESIYNGTLFLSTFKVEDTKLDEFKDLISYINNNFDRESLISKLQSRTFSPTKHLFPDDFNCSLENTNRNNPNPEKQKVALATYMNGEYLGTADFIGEEISKIGFEVKRMDFKEVSKMSYDGKTLPLIIAGQHLSQSLFEVLSLMVNQLGVIADSNGNLASKIRGAVAEKEVLKSVCQEVENDYMIPLFHYKKFFIANKKENLRLMSISSSNVHYDRLVR